MVSHAYVVSFGQSKKVCWTRYHAEQFMRALELNGTAYKLSVVKL